MHDSSNSSNPPSTTHTTAATHQNFVIIPYNLLDSALEKIMKSRGGVSCINQILKATLGEDLPESLNFIHNDFDRTALHEAIELLNEVSVEYEEILFQILIDHQEVVS